MNEALWYVSRATGMVSLVLLTASLVLGLLTAGRVGGRSPVRAALHRTLSLLMVVFIAAHVLTAVVETYVDIGWVSLLLPFTSGYERFSVGLGTLALDLLAAVTVTSVLRDRLSTRAWTWVHRTSYALWPVALVHGLATADTDTAVVLGISVSCLLAVLVASLRRFRTPELDHDRRRTVHAQVWR